MLLHHPAVCARNVLGTRKRPAIAAFSPSSLPMRMGIMSEMGSTMTSPEWQVPEVAESDLTYAVTSSVLEQFAQGHTVGDVLRELVQNEYDAGGGSLSVSFGPAGLEVHGNGRVIDRAGWRRLSVMLGTGRVAGDSRDIPQKVNGIGSKNHGLRSLFLIGNQIYIRSGGYQTVLDLRLGALREPRADPASADLPGAHVFVPYRDHSDGRLEAYGPAREAQDIKTLADGLAPTLVKLARPEARRSLRSVAVSSDRLDRLLTWRQNVKVLRRHRLGGPLLERTIELRDSISPSTSAILTKIVELEYEKSFEIPSNFRSRDFADYFRASAGRARIGVSLRLKRKRLDFTDLGSFYYPLGFANSSTGSAISVSAPFDMNGDRSALTDPASSSWNEWLMDTAADFAFDLLTNEWLASFESAAFLALEETRQSAAPQFTEKMSRFLRERACWPTRESVKGSRKPRLVAASDLMLGSSPQLEALVGDERSLDSRLANGRIYAMARKAGAKDFTIASAIRLRCAGQDTKHLVTKLGGDAALVYRDFPNALADISRQEQFGKAFDAQRLTPSNRSDLNNAPTTLTAAGTLAAPCEPLWVVDEAVADFSPVPLNRRLHPTLVQYKSIRRLCKPSNVTAWARDVANQAIDRTASEEDREALYKYLLLTPETIGTAAWPTLRRAPIMRDHRSDWIAPEQMIQRRASGTARIETALHFPSRDISRNTTLLRRLRIRSKIERTDLVRYARIVSEQPPLAEGFEETLNQLRALLTRPTVTALRSIPFLQSSNGGLAAPADIYLRTQYLINCVGPHAGFAAGRHTVLHERLGCRDQPDLADIVAFLGSLRAADDGPPHPEVIYPALVEALRANGNSSRLASEPVLFVGGKWHAPADVLIGKRHRQVFVGAVPVLDAGGLDRVYKSLGASAEPAARHWIRFFEWLEEQSGAGDRPLRQAQRRALRLAYSKLGTLPADVPDRWHVFLDTKGRLHTRDDVRASRYLVNDDPRTADVATAAGLPVAFADLTDAATRRFYTLSGVRLLTEVRRHVGINAGDQRLSPPWFQESREVDRLREPAFASAVHAVAAATSSHTATPERQLRRQLAEVTNIVFVTELQDIYRIGSFSLTVPSDVAHDGNRIALRFVRSRTELYGLLARAVAGMAEATMAQQQPLTDSIFRLMMSDSPADIERYLTQRGIAWTASDDREVDDVSVDDEADDRTPIAEALKEKLLQVPRRTGASPSPGASTDTQQRPEERTRRMAPLPLLGDVSLQEASAAEWVPRDPERTGGGVGASGLWRPRSPAEQEEDRAIGLRGEELVYRAEVERVRALGYPESRVIWTSKSDPGADHDIRSVDEGGRDLWLEVKSTVGRHGRFDWPRAEFELALRVRERYILCRVFEVNTTHATLRREQDPVAKLLAGAMRLDISSLAAEVAPLSV